MGTSAGEMKCYKAELNFNLRDSNLISLEGGITPDAIPENACAIIKSLRKSACRALLKDEKAVLTEVTEGLKICVNGKNAIWKLSDILFRTGILNWKARKCIGLIAQVMKGYDESDELLGTIITSVTMARTEGNILRMFVAGWYLQEVSEQQISMHIRKEAAQRDVKVVGFYRYHSWPSRIGFL